MKGFKSFRKNYHEYCNQEFCFKEDIKLEPNVSHRTALENGFDVDLDHDVYTYKNLGAFVTNISSDITVNNLNSQYDELLRCNPYHIVVEMMKQGYKFCLGPAFPSRTGNISKHCNGLYCENYMEIAEKDTQISL